MKYYTDVFGVVHKVEETPSSVPTFVPTVQTQTPPVQLTPPQPTPEPKKGGCGCLSK